MSAPPLLEMRGIVKRYGEVTALAGTGFTLRAGEVHALVGENGAGKSTLVKILAGALSRDAGEIRIEGRAVEIDSPSAALALGIGMIPQDLNLVPELSVAENVFLGDEPVRGRGPFLDRPAMERAARAILAPLGETGDVRSPVAALSIARRQLVEIARALARRARVLALDEPTAPLSGNESAALFRTLARLRGEGVGILYISHRLEEIYEIAEHVTVLRDGEVVASASLAEIERPALIRLMVGRELEAPGEAARPAAGKELLRLEGIAGGRVEGIDLVLRRGEILGLAGLVGAGRSELVRLIFGADPRRAGRMFLEGCEVTPRTPREAIDLGIGLLTEDRNRLGLVLPMNVRENLTLASLTRHCRGPFLSAVRECAAAGRQFERLRIKARSPEAEVEELSGGNRQKVVLGRWLESGCKVLLFDEPSAGVDVGARHEIFALIRSLAADGTGVIVVSSDLDELLALADRVVVMCEGRLRGELSRAEATREKIMTLATARGAAGTRA